MLPVRQLIHKKNHYFFGSESIVKIFGSGLDITVKSRYDPIDMLTNGGKMTATSTASEPSSKPNRKGPGKMTDSHKKALAEGRRDGKIVSRYLDALETHRPKRGRKVSRESLERRLAAIEAEIPQAKPLKRVALIQQKMDIQERLAQPEVVDDFPALEREFQDIVVDFSQRRDISFDAWVKTGVKPEVLKAAGLTRKVSKEQSQAA